ncbi:MAG: hypothetical protein AB1646_00345 [Thermodesulfobacteriota bacterium]
MGDCHNHDLPASPVEDNGIWVALQAALAAAGIGQWESTGACSDLLDRPPRRM